MEKSFVILSSCGWGDMLQRPHHLARSIAKLGFLGPVIAVVVRRGKLTRQRLRLWSDYCRNYSFKYIKEHHRSIV